MNVYMFHYVNDSNFQYFHFDCNDFENVINKLIEKKLNILSFTEFKNKITNNEPIDNSILLTFDDGTIDHYKKVYPILKKYNISALFFLCSNILNNVILDVNLIHQLIANSNFDDLYNSFEKLLKENDVNINATNMLINTEYDDARMLYFKQMLQFILPKEVKDNILISLAKQHNISLKFNDYYMNLKQIQEMKLNGMEFGFHTVNHKRLEKLSYDEQEYEILKNYQELLNQGIINDDAPFSYPFGSCNSDTLKILKKNNIKYAFTINSQRFDYGCDLLNIPRYDCNVLKRGVDSE